MKDYRRGAHTVFEIHLHVVWTTKYRRPALTGEVALRVRDLIREICAQHEVTIRKGHVAKDHLPLFVSIPPQVTISRLIQWLKGKTAYKRLGEFPHLQKQFWGRHLLSITHKPHPQWPRANPGLNPSGVSSLATERGCLAD